MPKKINDSNKSILFNHHGGDGYSVNVDQAIGGMPSYPRYSNNCRPVFDGSLLQNGGSDSGCDCNSTSNIPKDNSIFSLIKQQGGNNIKLTQFDAVKEVSQFLAPLSISSLKKLITKVFLYDLSYNKPKKSKQLGGYTMELQKIIAPLGKSNLLVIAGLLLLHYFAVEKQREKQIPDKKMQLKGGDPFFQTISTIIAPSGINQFGSAILLVLLKQAFDNKIFKQNNVNQINKKNKVFKMYQKGGNPLKDLIAPLGTNAFVATGLLVILERIFTNKMKEINTNDQKTKKLIGGRISKKYDQLLKIITPLSFNAFATDKFLTMMATKKKI